MRTLSNDELSKATPQSTEPMTVVGPPRPVAVCRLRAQAPVFMPAGHTTPPTRLLPLSADDEVPHKRRPSIPALLRLLAPSNAVPFGDYMTALVGAENARWAHVCTDAAYASPHLRVSAVCVD